MSYGVLQDWADLGIGSAILPRSKLNEGRDAGIPIVDGTDPLEIRYRCLWQGGPNTAPKVRSLTKFLKEVAPSIVQGLVR
jgi:DNA-binding transcriptional LysR family regulator